MFIAPVDGYYVFSWSTSQYGSRWTHSVITKNGEDLLVESVHSYNAGDSTSQTVVLHLVTGDRVWIKRKSGDYPYNLNNNFDAVFTGFKL